MSDYPFCSFSVEPAAAGIRLDVYLTEKHSSYSRAFFQKAVQEGSITLNGALAKANKVLKAGDKIAWEKKEYTKNHEELHALKNHAFGISIIAQKQDFIIINKPAGLVVHKPHIKSTEYSVTDWIDLHYPDAQGIGIEGRSGIVHRLDKDTSGLLIIARTSTAYTEFLRLFKEREIKKKYYAFVEGVPGESGFIDYAISRHPTLITRMTHIDPQGKPAMTDWKKIKAYGTKALLELSPLTGRTHQLRVHCAAIGYPIVGDSLYGKKSSEIKRQALHAYSLNFIYNNTVYNFTAELPDDMKKLCTP
jgi:23S rRNA pseudouridine1911/1915/1917 synthase